MKTVKQFLVTFALMIVVLTNMSATAFAGDPSDAPAASNTLAPTDDPKTPATGGTKANPNAKEDYKNLPLPDGNEYGDIAKLKDGKADELFAQLVIGAITNVRYIIGAVSILLIIYAAIRMIVAQGAEDEYTAQKRNILYAIIGLAVIGLSGELVRILNVYCPDGGKDLTTNLPCTKGGFLQDPNAIIRSATLFNQRTQFVITFIKYLIGSVAVFGIIRSGLRLITMFGNEEKVGEDKKAIFYNIVGLLMIIMADSVVNNVFYKIDLSRYPSVGGATPSFNLPQGVKELAGFTNLVVTIVTPIAILVLLYGAFLYVTSATNEETQTKAKRLIFAVIIGLLIMYGAFAIVSTVISGSFQSGGAGTVSTTQ